MKMKIFSGVFALFMIMALGSCSELVMQEEFDESEMNIIVEDGTQKTGTTTRLIHDCWEEEYNNETIPYAKWSFDTDVKYNSRYEYIVSFKYYYLVSDGVDGWVNFGFFRLRDLSNFSKTVNLSLFDDRFDYRLEKQGSHDEMAYITGVATIYRKDRKTGKTELINRCYDDPIILWFSPCC